MKFYNNQLKIDNYNFIYLINIEKCIMSNSESEEQ